MARILYYQFKGSYIYFIYELDSHHTVIKLPMVEVTMPLVTFLEHSGGKPLSSVIDIENFNQHLNKTYTNA